MNLKSFDSFAINLFGFVLSGRFQMIGLLTGWKFVYNRKEIEIRGKIERK